MIMQTIKNLPDQSTDESNRTQTEKTAGLAFSLTAKIYKKPRTTSTKYAACLLNGYDNVNVNWQIITHKNPHMKINDLTKLWHG